MDGSGSSLKGDFCSDDTSSDLIGLLIYTTIKAAWKGKENYSLALVFP